jgi:hypothetical protein
MVIKGAEETPHPARDGWGDRKAEAPYALLFVRVRGYFLAFSDPVTTAFIRAMELITTLCILEYQI